MKSTVGGWVGGLPKKQTKEQGCVNSVCDKGEGVQIPTSYMEAPLCTRDLRGARRGMGPGLCEINFSPLRFALRA